MKERESKSQKEIKEVDILECKFYEVRKRGRKRKTEKENMKVRREIKRGKEKGREIITKEGEKLSYRVNKETKQRR